MDFFGKRLVFQRAKGNTQTRTSPTVVSNSGALTEKDNVISLEQAITEETGLEAQKKLKNFQRQHRWDPNLPVDTLKDLDEATHAHDLQHDLKLVGAFEENSPYPEVRAAVRNVSGNLPYGRIATVY